LLKQTANTKLFSSTPTNYKTLTAISGCKIPYLVHQVNTKQYDLRNKPEHDKIKTNAGCLEGVTLTQRYTYYRFYEQ
jgi:hypothetical protein